jgi:hypothetical protein
MTSQQWKPLATALAVVVIGPAMYVFSRAHSLTAAFQRIQPGDTPAQVTAVLGRPGSEVDGNGGSVEYRYHSWPIPTVWIVRFRSGRVVEKASD